MNTSTPQDRAARTAASVKRSAEQRRKSMKWARDAGFSERVATFAAATAERLRAHGKLANASTVKAQMTVDYPFLERS